jgi:hypothetical protein
VEGRRGKELEKKGNGDGDHSMLLDFLFPLKKDTLNYEHFKLWDGGNRALQETDNAFGHQILMQLSHSLRLEWLLQGGDNHRMNEVLEPLDQVSGNV